MKKRADLFQQIEDGFQENDEELIAAVFRLIPSNIVRNYQSL